MTFTAPIAAGTLAAVAAGLAGLVVVAYILKLRRRRFEVPFSKLWQRVLRERETTSLWRKLRRLLSLALQLLFLALVLGAALDPKLGEARVSGRNVVLLVDASASMKALDRGPGEPARIERAKDEARAILRGLGGGDAAMVVQMDGQATALTRFESDMPRLVQAVDRIAASDTPANLPRALGAAADALRGRRSPLIVIVGDGAYPEDARAGVVWEGDQVELGQVDLRGIDVRFVPVGAEGRNVGITAFNVRRYLANKLSYEALVEVENFGAQEESVELTLLAGDNPVNVRTLKLGPRERKREIYPDLGGEASALRATIEPAAGADVFPLDDTAFALLPERRGQRVLLVSEGNLYLEGALLVDPTVVVDRLPPGDYERERPGLPPYDVIVFDSWAPAELPPSPAAIYFGGEAAKLPFAVRRTADRPILTVAQKDHPVTRWVALDADINIDKAHVFAPQAGDVVLARAIHDPVVVAGRREGKRLLAFGFGLDGTDIMLRVAFPVLVVNALDWFAGEDSELMTTYRTGQAWAVPLDPDDPATQVTVKGPAGELTAPVVGGRARLYGRHAGLYELRAGTGARSIAANLADPQESNVQPQAKLALGGRELGAPPAFLPSVSRSIWLWLVLGALALTSVEWLTYHRRITV